ncbi:glycosyltransferase [Streptomyces avicenniae]|uniref:glycosyltransferase n=1 Tax=Streptomyces avicenniae TaxID=500153 RepID=UPI00069AB889|nr:glycosyltransferase [Streptomyces avicenniae]
MNITFLLNNAYGIGGTIRAVSNLSAAFAERHTVTVVSLHRHRDATSFTFDPRVRIVPLIDGREGAQDAALLAQAGPSRVLPEWDLNGSRLSDERMGAFLADTDADVVIGTRPPLNTYLGRLGDARYLRVAQEHSQLGTRSAVSRDLQLAVVPLLDAFLPVTAADAADYRAALPGVRTRILPLPNASPAPAVAPSTGDSRVIVAAGRLTPTKRYDRLLDAFAKLTGEFPDWELRIYGRGPAKPELREHIERLGLSDRARLMGAAAPVETEWAKGAIAAVTSEYESFGLTVVEAMACGVPVVSVDCPVGPREIITHGEDGLLVPPEGGPDAVAQGLRTLMTDAALRHRMGAKGKVTAARYRPDAIARRYEELFWQLRPALRPAGKLRSLLGGRKRRAAAPVTAEPAPGPPSARCAATPDGGFTVALGPSARGELVLRLRRSSPRREIRVPLTGDGDGRAAVPRAAHTLAEGRWDCFLATGDGKPRRVAAALVEQAALVTAPPAVDAGGVTSWIPYTTKDGNLTIRVWRRPVHAEVIGVAAHEEAATVTVRLLGGLAPGQVEGVFAACALDTGRDFPVSAEALDGERLLLTLPYGEAFARRAPEGATRWEIRLRTADGRVITAGRIGGDGADRKGTDVYPAAVRGGAAVRVGYTSDNALVMSARAVAPPAADG